MATDNVYIDQINEVETDFRAEVIAAEMIEHDTPADRVLIVPLGAYNRPQSKDIEGVEQEVSDYDNKEYVLIKTHKEGLYDKLPEGLFHTPISYVSDKSEQQVIEAIRRHRLEEKAARNFFLPFDAAISNVRVAICLYEIQLDKKFHFNQLVNIFTEHWEIFQHLNVLQANLFLQFLPIIHRVRDDWRAIEILFELMFQSPAKLEMRTQTHQNDVGEDSSLLYSQIGKGTLGVDITTGNCFEGGDFAEMMITFGPVSAEQVHHFTGEQNQEKVVLMLCDYLLPADVDIVITYDLAKHDRGFYLNNAGAISNNCEMGVSTYL
jgi:type VI secretion system protein ImpH